MKKETHQEKLDRVRSMASGSATWDLSANDIAALKHVMAIADENAASAARIAELEAAIREYLEWGPTTGSDRDLLADGFRAALANPHAAAAAESPR